MLRHNAAALCALAFAAMIPASAYADPALRGTWRGTAHQSDGQAFQTEMTITSAGGAIAYPGLNCGGDLVRIAEHGAYEVFEERLTYGAESGGGNCIDRGVIVVARNGRGMMWSWTGRYRGETAVAWATLSR